MNNGTTVSMTGFGKASDEEAGVFVEAEIKVINHRFLDLAIRLPKPYSCFEHEPRPLMTSSLNRGRVEITVTRRASGERAAGALFNRETFDAYLSVYRQVMADMNVRVEGSDPRLAFELLSRREVLDGEETVQEVKDERELLLRVIRRALEGVVGMRASEGAALAQDLSARTANLRSIAEKLQGAAVLNPQRLKERLLARIEKLTPEVQMEPQRLVSEIALLVDRSDVTEEITRIFAHLDHFSRTLPASPNGRKLDFLIQELGREFNTVGSKSQEIEISTLVVEAKVELEKMREQVQNLV